MLSKREVFDGVPEEYLSHKERYENAIRNSVVAFSLVRKMQEEGKTSINNYRDVVGGLLGSSVLRDGSPLGLHYIMFMPAILNQANEEQQEKWLPRAWNCSIIGSYAQTELGHGTFIRGLETTATYDAATKQFVLHSPTLTAYKWWPGGLGQTANYCIVVAQLYTKGQCHGIHSFIIQVRDEETHMPLPGIKIGEIGAKLGLNAVNNGFLGFDNYRIPRTNMLMKHAQVLEDGTYVKSRHSKLNYGAMVFVRVVIVFDMVNYLSKAVTIATRFSAVRRQCQLKAGETECQILDYVTQQHKLFVSIAAAHAFRITANKLWLTFNEVNEQLVEGNLQRLPELHALACCLKAVTTADTAACVERCRLACGGHGYMMSSSLPLTYGLVTAACTYEGENTVLLLQTARFLVKTYQQLDSKALTPTVAYLKTAAAERFCVGWSNTTEGIIRGFQVVAMRVIIMSTFNEEVQEMSRTVSPQLKEVLHQLVDLYCTYWALEKLSDLLLYTPISQKEVESLRLRYEETLTNLRPNAVGLVDAFDLRDEMLQSTLGSYDGRVYERLMEEAMKSPLNAEPMLQSTLGSYDGRVYERLMEEAMKSPLNAEPVNYTFHKYLKPFMQGKL
ncbi:putative peroxisomal acyl-coenzyme A oxidase 1 [Papilio machaon]|uniref:Acyl-coenzyme A oxidase n=1 Tax=Papilio machaon TaxID=76193 RepID=A0A194QV72_PAPMA|nr:putative peroxisomal acyl-coenzyme A oxidase 1 [Papilio machaon]